MLKQLQQIVEGYADTDAAQEASKQLNMIKADTAIMRQINDGNAAAKCRSWMSMAHSFEINKDYKRAVEYYEKIVNEFPDTSFAEDARQKRDEAKKLL